MAIARRAIRDARVLPNAGKKVADVHRLMLERFAAHPELEGERLIQGGDIADPPLHYDIWQ